MHFSCSFSVDTCARSSQHCFFQLVEPHWFERHSSERNAGRIAPDTHTCTNHIADKWESGPVETATLLEHNTQVGFSREAMIMVIGRQTLSLQNRELPQPLRFCTIIRWRQPHVNDCRNFCAKESIIRASLPSIVIKGRGRSLIENFTFRNKMREFSFQDLFLLSLDSYLTDAPSGASTKQLHFPRDSDRERVVNGLDAHLDNKEANHFLGEIYPPEVRLLKPLREMTSCLDGIHFHTFTSQFLTKFQKYQ